MNNKTIIFTTIIFLLTSFVFLSFVEKKQANMNNQNIWMLYFIDPKSHSLDFAIENHSQTNTFHWQISLDKKIVTESDSIIAPGETKTITIPTDEKVNLSDKKITISVTADNFKKEIYKNF